MRDEMIWWDVVLISRVDFSGDRYEASTYTYGTEAAALQKYAELEGKGAAVLLFMRERRIVMRHWK